MYQKNYKLYLELKKNDISKEQDEIILKELGLIKNKPFFLSELPSFDFGIYNDFNLFGYNDNNKILALKTLDELLEKDKQREEDGFKRKIRIGQVIKKGAGNKKKIIVVPTTTEPKLYHDRSVTEEGEGGTGGAGDGEEGEIIGEQSAEPQQGEGEGEGAGQGEGGSHEVGTNAFDLGKILTEKFNLPNLQKKGKKRSFSKYIYDLTDINKGFGQIIDKKRTVKKIIETNILLGKVSNDKKINTEDLLINPADNIYRIFSKEKDFESQAIVFFVRDYSGSMDGKPTEAVVTEHLFLYSWLVYQYKNNVESRFILHDTEAKEVPDFHTYYRSNVAGGTNIYPAFELVNQIVEKENLAKDYNIYVFYGTDGDDWDSTGKKMLEACKKMTLYANRIGITVAKNSWTGSRTTVIEKYLDKSGILKEKANIIKTDTLNSEQADENRLIEGIKKLLS